MSKLLRSLSFGRRKKKPSNLDALRYLEEKNIKTDETKVLEAIDLYNKISKLEYESNLQSLPNVPNKHQQDITSLTMELNKLEEILSQKREELSKLKSLVMYPSVPKDVNEQKIQNLKAQLELLDRPEEMKKLHNEKGKLIRLIQEAKTKAENKFSETVSNNNKIILAKMKQELGLLLKNEKINVMFQKKMREQIQEDKSIKEATELLAEHGIEGGKRRKKRKTKKNKKNKTKKGKKFRKGKKYTRK
jgi:nitrate reductase NapAB chaperone NapD